MKIINILYFVRIIILDMDTQGFKNTKDSLQEHQMLECCAKQLFRQHHRGDGQATYVTITC